ncbi:hypothetical protein BC941DRAFT_434983 [Chlamydoabsidia padenii]|nr:hypothetical protein BC941DRAFT_434983 [Chlamydoabsidia padenii]
MDPQIKWHKDLLVKDVFLSPPMTSNAITHPGTLQHRQLKKMEMAPSDLLLDDTDIFGLNDSTCLLLDDQQQQVNLHQQQQQQLHHQHCITSIYPNDLPTPPAIMDSLLPSDYLGIKRRHSSICSDSSSDDGSSVHSDSDKRPCLDMHSPRSLPESSPQLLPMFDFDDDEEDDDAMDESTLHTEFQPYSSILESMTDDNEDEDEDDNHPSELNTPHVHSKLTITMKKVKKTKKQYKTTRTSKSQSNNNNNNNNKKSSLSDNMMTDDALPVYVPHGAPQVDLRYSSQGLYKHLLKQRVDWCRYCGTTEGVNWRPGPWGKRTLCNKHGCDYKGYGFACKLPRLDLTAFVKEPMDQRVRPVLQLFCSCCHRSESWQDNLLVQCDGCPMAWHQQCRRQQDLTDEFCQSSAAFFCSGDQCRDNLKKKRVVVEFSRKRLPLMRTPKQQQEQQALMDGLKC